MGNCSLARMDSLLFARAHFPDPSPNLLLGKYQRAKKMSSAALAPAAVDGGSPIQSCERGRKKGRHTQGSF